jgi:hypothetical protein
MEGLLTDMEPRGHLWEIGGNRYSPLDDEARIWLPLGA